jgi:hypothetical protein
MTNKTFNKIILSATTAMLLTACGSSGSSTTTPADTTKPEITLNSGNISLTVGETYTDAGATAIDDVDGDITSNITTTGTVDTSTAGTYTITYTVSDAAGNTTTVTRTVTVNPVAVAAVSLADAAAQTYTKDVAISPLAFVNSGGAVDSCDVTPELPAGLAVAVNNNTCEISGTPTVVADTATYTVTGTNDTGSDTASVDITVNDIPNEAPTANAGDDVSVLVNTEVTLTGSGTDNDGEIVSYSWADDSGEEVATTAEYTYTPTEEGTDTFTLTVTDNIGATATDTVTVDVTVESRFASDDTTITDNVTQLVWDNNLSDVGSCTDGKSEPTIEQFQTIIDYSKSELAVVDGFSLPVNFTHYKTSDNWDVELMYGQVSNVNTATKTICVDASNYVAAEDVNYTRDDNTTLVTGTDGLVWTDSELFSDENGTTDYSPKTYDEARNKCQDLNMSLPSLSELNALYDRGAHSIVNGFTVVHATTYWTDTVYDANSSLNWVVNFNNNSSEYLAGQLTGVANDNSVNAYVRCVK